jgi:hypothetical protein
VKDLVYRIVSFHNRAGLPRDETELCLFYAKLLRDADKLDIWKVLTTHYLCLDETLNKAIELELPDTPGISDKVYEAVIDKKIVDSRHVRNLNDFKALQIGWVFDINFKPALDAVIRRNYIEVICSVLPACEQVERIKAVVGRYIETRFMDEPVSTAR